ncbi:MAG: S9 family peptidase, partial [Parvularculaceae bacterium]|nr:S9 family peptidase [Parvularculaceae bacterium]
AHALTAAALALAATLALAPPASANDPVATPDVFGALPDVAEAQISPNGRFLGLLENTKEGTTAVIYDLENRGARPEGVKVEGSKARDLTWIDDDHLLVMASITQTINLATGKRKFEFFRWIAISRSQRAARIILESTGGYFNTGAGQLISTLPQTPPGDALFYASRGAARGLVRVNLDTGDEEFQTRDTDQSYAWIVGADGRPTVRLDYDANKKERRIFASSDGGKSFKLIKSFPWKALEPLAFAPQGLLDDKTAVVVAHGPGETNSIVTMNLADGSTSEVLFHHPRHEIDGVGYDPRRARALDVQYTDDMPRQIPFDPADAGLLEALKGPMVGVAAIIVSQSADKGRTVLKLHYPDRPSDFFLYTAATGRLARIAGSYKALDGKLLSKREKFDYVASDGLKIPGYLTVPTGASRKAMPLIVLPHGGPGARDDMAFDWWAGFYAARGYLVYQPNFRGSTGYGKSFYDAGAAQWGRKMQDDVSEGVRKLVADGVADGKRVCIVGASYGGYAALAGMTLTPELYACGVSVAGVSDLPAMLGSEKNDGAERFWESRMGASRFKDTSELNAVSPAKQARNVRAPVMLIHGKDDTVVPLEQSAKMRDALKGAGKDVEYVVLDGEDHWLSVASSRTEMLKRSIDFIDRHIGAR